MRQRRRWGRGLGTWIQRGRGRGNASEAVAADGSKKAAVHEERSPVTRDSSGYFVLLAMRVSNGKRIETPICVVSILLCT